MAKYKLISQAGWDAISFPVGSIRSTETDLLLQYYVKNFPEDFKLIEESMCTEKTITGYNLIDQKNQKVVVKALGLSSIFNPLIISGSIGYYLPKIKELDIFDWFEPVYKDVKEEPMCTEKTIKLSLDQAKKMYGKNPEMDELLLANFSKEELTKKELPNEFKKLNPISGYYIHSGNSKVEKLHNKLNPLTDNNPYHIFATEKQAKSALAMAQLSQLMAVYNDGWEPDFGSMNNRSNWCIVRYTDEIKWQNVGKTYNFLAFKSLELCELFLANFEPLIKEYFMID